MKIRKQYWRPILVRMRIPCILGDALSGSIHFVPPSSKSLNRVGVKVER